MYYSTNYISPLGKILLASDGNNLIGLWFEEQNYYPATIKKNIADNSQLPVFNITKKWLDRYFNGEEPEYFGTSLIS